MQGSKLIGLGMAIILFAIFLNARAAMVPTADNIVSVNQFSYFLAWGGILLAVAGTAIKG